MSSLGQLSGVISLAVTPTIEEILSTSNVFRALTEYDISLKSDTSISKAKLDATSERGYASDATGAPPPLEGEGGESILKEGGEAILKEREGSLS